ncbi:MAG: peptide/nickel transport system permease protein [Chloroflexi bacterium]|jgi:ABC-type dipeptide/oligopeptide/nickel transport system permease component|nr:MAG: peptide/nickel transport system permease protein [Chloroflexota bacterium]
MLRYIAWRLALLIPTLLAASVVVFLVMRVLPGDVSQVIAGDVAVSPAVREALAEELGLNDPLHVQYGQWLWSMVNGKFGGNSLESKESIRSIIGQQLPVTLLLTGYTLLLSILVSLPLGMLAARWSNRWPDYITRIVSLGGLSLPSLLVAVLVLLGLLLAFRWSPPILYASPWADPWTHLQIMIWPALILAWEQSSHLVRVTRASVLEALDRSYVATARSKGLAERVVLVKHALPNALIPTVTMIGLHFGVLISGAVILENIFGLPGIGRGIVHAAQVRDYPVVQSLAVLLVLFSLVVNLVVDIVYSRLDPRVGPSS